MVCSGARHVSNRSLSPCAAADLCTAGPEIHQVALLEPLEPQHHRSARRLAVSRTLSIFETTSQ